MKNNNIGDGKALPPEIHNEFILQLAIRCWDTDGEEGTLQCTHWLNKITNIYRLKPRRREVTNDTSTSGIPKDKWEVDVIIVEVLMGKYIVSPLL